MTREDNGNSISDAEANSLTPNTVEIVISKIKAAGF